MTFPSIIVAIMWAVHLWVFYFGGHVYEYGVLPRTLEGLRGILFAPFIHGDWTHLINNTYPILILGTAIFWFYQRSAKWVVIYSIIMSGLWVWAMGRSSYHIGASGLIYAWGVFIFASGVYIKNKRLMGLSLLVVFLYGSLIWGVIPLVKEVSWEAHLFGAIAGWILAYYFKSEGPKRKKFEWEEKDEDYEIEFWNMSSEEVRAYYEFKAQQKASDYISEASVKYHYVEKKSNDSA